MARSTNTRGKGSASPQSHFGGAKCAYYFLCKKVKQHYLSSCLGKKAKEKPGRTKRVGEDKRTNLKVFQKIKWKTILSKEEGKKSH